MSQYMVYIFGIQYYQEVHRCLILLQNSSIFPIKYILHFSFKSDLYPDSEFTFNNNCLI